MPKNPKLLTNREMELFRQLVFARKDISDLCPDVGMGPSIQTIAQKTAEGLSFEIDEDDIAEAIEIAGAPEHLG